jgi:hypothetical protein
MAFLRGSTTSELPESQVEYRDDNPARRWISLLIYLFLALIVATLVVLAGRWVYHKVHNSNGPTPTAITPQGSQNTLTSPNSAKKSTSGNLNSGNSSSGNTATNNTNNKATPPPSSSGRPAPSPSNLPNNGPGDVVALFLGSSLLAGSLHYLATSRKVKEL